MWTVAGLARELAEGKTTSRKLVEEALARIGDPAGEGARAFLKVYAEEARPEAEHSDRLRRVGRARSAVEGLPVSVKDLYDVAGDVTRAGSKLLAGAAPAATDALAVARLRAAGAVIVGRTNMVEFAFGTTGLNPHYGTPKNPWDRKTGRVPGGSSSGAAVAQADGMCVMALGSDTRGSIRQPAALCGVTGWKPTQRRVPRDGAFPLSYTLDTVGPLANSVACCAAYDEVLAAEPRGALSALPAKGLRLLLPRGSLLQELQYEPSKSSDVVAAKLRPFRGTLTADAEHRFNDVFASGRVIEAGCNAHGRRRFSDAEATQPVLACEGGAFLGAIYGEEEKAQQLGLRGDALREHRQQHIRPIVRDFECWLDAVKPTLLPSEPLAAAINYYLNHKNALFSFVDDPLVPIDNSPTEREFQNVAKLRLNMLFAGSTEGAHRACVLLGIIATCRALRVPAQAYLAWAFERLGTHRDVFDLPLEDMTPAAFKKTLG